MQSSLTSIRIELFCLLRRSIELKILNVRANSTLYLETALLVLDVLLTYLILGGREASVKLQEV